MKLLTTIRKTLFLYFLFLLFFNFLLLANKKLNIEIIRKGSQYQYKIAVFQLKDFPTINSPIIDSNTLKSALNGYNFEFLRSIKDIDEKLSITNFDLLVMPYGSAFPLDSWEKIKEYVYHGGNLVVLGGSPFYQPVIWKNKKNSEKKSGYWELGTSQPSFAHDFLIAPSEEIDLNSEPFYYEDKKIHSTDFSGWEISNFPIPDKVYEMTFRFTTKKDFEKEDGTAGPREAVLRPLIHITGKNGTPVACPLMEIDRLRGYGAGARWIFAPSDAILSMDIIKKIIDRAVQGSIEISARPINAVIEPDEFPSIRLNIFKPKRKLGVGIPHKVKIEIIDKKGNKYFTSINTLSGSDEYRTLEMILKPSKKLTPGFYIVMLEILESDFNPYTIKTGFWVKDDLLLRSAEKLSVSKDWILKGKHAFPIIGTTYMASDVHRKFLFEPNPYIWDKDFSEMEKHGINFIRTGLWTGWSRIMVDPGAIDENILKALDAFILTAAAHRIYVCFNFFAFSPPLFGGSNPYLDPRSLEGQKALITLISSRYKDIPWIHFDLINEPSYSPPDALWQNILIGDGYESWAWNKYLDKYKDYSKSELRNKWMDSFDNLYSMPHNGDLYYNMVRDYRRPRKAIDFNLLSQEIIKFWSDSLSRVIKKVAGNPLVTLGQDEGGTGTRPSQQFFYPSVDYTSVHTWWLTDDILWDGACTKIPEKPNLIQETGLMRLENINGEAWRNLQLSRETLDRKFAYSFASRGAGFVQWAWNINPYQPIDNESVIGFFRPDGTAKLELSLIQKYSKFYNKTFKYFSDFEPEKVTIILPHSKLFASRPNSTEPTKRLIRILSDNFGLTPQMISEYHLSMERLQETELIIIPTAEMLCDSALKILLDATKSGKKLLFTGAIDGNSFGEITSELIDLGLNKKSVPIEFYEKTNWGPLKENIITFDRQLRENLRKSTSPPLSDLKGNIWLEPLPLEMARESEPLKFLLKAVLKKANIEFNYSEDPIALKILKNDDIAFIICVNEKSADGIRTARIERYELKINVPKGQSKLLLFDYKNGKMIAETGFEDTSIITR